MKNKPFVCERCGTEWTKRGTDPTKPYALCTACRLEDSARVLEVRAKVFRGRAALYRQSVSLKQGRKS